MLVPENLEVLSLRHWVEYQSNARYNSIEKIMGLSERGVTVVCTGSLYTGNELEKCLILAFIHLSLQCLYVSRLVYNDTFILNVD